MEKGKKVVIILSGGFDPIHVGHLRMMQKAKDEYNATVVVGVNSDEWLVKKKGRNFMPFNERCELISGYFCVDEVVGFDDSDNTASQLIRDVANKYSIDKYDVFFGNGGDRQDGNTPEHPVCEELNVDMLWGLGGGKVQSSSELLESYAVSGAKKKDGFNMQ
jgi:cytidyltransferase-like protein